MSNHHLIKRSLASIAVIAAVGFPSAAQAMQNNGGSNLSPTPVSSTATGELPPGFHTDESSGGYFTKQASLPSASVARTSSGFQWGDAGIGAAGAVVLLSAGALGATATRRRRRPVVS